MPRIFDFATVTAWESRLQALATIAEPERWSYHSVPAKVALPVLDNYVRDTFIRAFDQQKIVTAPEGSHSASKATTLACFNYGSFAKRQNGNGC